MLSSFGPSKDSLTHVSCFTCHGFLSRLSYNGTDRFVKRSVFLFSESPAITYKQGRLLKEHRAKASSKLCRFAILRQ